MSLIVCLVILIFNFLMKQKLNIVLCRNAVNILTLLIVCIDVYDEYCLLSK